MRARESLSDTYVRTNGREQVLQVAAAAREKATAEAATQEDRMASREEAAERDRTSANVHNWRERRD